MSTNSLITEAKGYVADAYDAVEEMGGTRPEVQNLDNLTAAIDSIRR